VSIGCKSVVKWGLVVRSEKKQTKFLELAAAVKAAAPEKGRGG